MLLNEMIEKFNLSFTEEAIQAFNANEKEEVIAMNAVSHRRY